MLAQISLFLGLYGFTYVPFNRCLDYNSFMIGEYLIRYDKQNRKQFKVKRKRWEITVKRSNTHFCVQFILYKTTGVKKKKNQSTPNP